MPIHRQTPPANAKSAAEWGDTMPRLGRVVDSLNCAICAKLPRYGILGDYVKSQSRHSVV